MGMTTMDWGEGSDGFESAEGSSGPEWVWIGMRALVVGFFFFFFGFDTLGLCSIFIWCEDERK